MQKSFFMRGRVTSGFLPGTDQFYERFDKISMFKIVNPIFYGCDNSKVYLALSILYIVGWLAVLNAEDKVRVYFRGFSCLIHKTL